MKKSIKLMLSLPTLAISSFGLSSCVKDDIENLFQRVSSIEDKIEDLQSQIDELKNQISSLSEEMSNKVEEIKAEYTSKINEAQEAILGLKQEILDLSEDFKTAKEELKKDYEEKIANLENTVNEQIRLINQTNETLKGRLDDLTSKHNDDSEDVAEEIATLTSKIESNDQKIASLNEAFANAKRELEEDYNNKIDELQRAYESKVEELEGSIATLTQSIETLTSQMNTKIQEVKDDYNQKINALSSRVSTLESVTYHTVTFNTSGGSEVTTQQIKHGEKILRPTDPTKAGYTFKGWFVDNEAWSFIGYVVTENLTLTAKWEENYYTLSVSTNEIGYGTVSINNEIHGLTQTTIKSLFRYNENITVTANTKAKCSFDGWYVNNELVTLRENYTFSMPESDFSLEARFSPRNSYIYNTAHDGTLDDPFTSEDAIKVASQLSDDNMNTEFYVKGIIYSFQHAVGSRTDGYVSFFLQNENGSSGFECYKILKADGSSLTEDDVWVGAEVIVKGTFTIYYGTYETNTGVFVRNTGNGAPKPTPEDANYENVSDALTIFEGLSEGESTTKEYYYYGYVADIVTPYSETYQNITFRIYDYIGDYDNVLKCFRARCTKDQSTKIVSGAIVFVHGYVINYNGEAQLDAGCVVDSII